jgi:zinc transporter 1/2/3
MAAITPIILMVALGTHSMFEGIALGLMQQSRQAINLIISIIIHKVAETISISIALNKSFADFKIVLKFIFGYAFVTPIGTVIGIILGAESSPMIYMVFMSLACGTFFYVSCSELIVEEFSLPGNRWLKLLSFSIAAVVMGLLLLLGG